MECDKTLAICIKRYSKLKSIIAALERNRFGSNQKKRGTQTGHPFDEIWFKELITFYKTNNLFVVIGFYFQ